MPTLEEIQNQMKAVNVTDTFGTKKEIKALPDVLAQDETIKYMTSGLLNGNTWLITCTNKRVLFLDKGMIYGLQQIDIPLEKINSIGQHAGLILGEIEIWDGSSKMKIESVSKKTLKPFIDAVNKAREDLKASEKQVRFCADTKSESIPDQIKKLAELKDQGILTEEEFTIKKKELLAKM